MSRRLADPPYLAFPLRIARPADASFRGPAPVAAAGGCAEHIRGQIEQILFHGFRRARVPARVRRGLRTLLFEPNSLAAGRRCLPIPVCSRLVNLSNTQLNEV
ncbi:MAG: hypothetical protein MZW92_65640, partial [Comamonadaceae bacterium]|nr:hypothetical protein [Comamonadaceae bacterium]